MSAWEQVPTEPDAWVDWSEEQIEEWLRDVFDEIARYWLERKRHDQDGWYARDAGSAQCLALGHKPDEFGEWNSDDDHHQYGWDGDLLCLDTKYDTACTVCEGECDYSESVPSLWALPGVTGRVAQ